MSVTLYLRHGDCVEVLADYSEGSVGGVVSDPPYEISFMSRGWDATGVAYDPRLWGHLYRVLVPGGVVKAFSATRTFHRMGAAMQTAGFTDLSVEAWNYRSGFPKSMSIGKAIDRAAGAAREVIGFDAAKALQQTAKVGTQAYGDFAGSTGNITAPATDAARTWEGWGTALKPSWEPVLVGKKPD
jgi:site-specific DNA-methyltransferase (adenine-specific)